MKYPINNELRVVSVDTVLPDRVRANLAAAIGTHLPNPTGARLGEALGQLDTKLTVHDVLRLFENDHIRVSPNTPISEVDGARYNVALFAALGDELDLIDMGGGAFLAPYHNLVGGLPTKLRASVSPEKAAELRFALDSTFLTPEPLRGPSDSLREFVHRTANLDQVLQEHLQKATQLADEGAESLDELLDELDTITRETEEYVAQAAAELQVRKAEQQAQRLEIEHLDIDELADPHCL
jgi:hypothetical protein